ncbi:hypothetical protein J4219_03180 [Candidatus Woesearchaeota archaeon]|nr:hypothetical protein [Candidatus Woesearchaeota archaeon]
MSNHLKAYAAPKSWTLLKKVSKWTLRPLPGSQPLERSLPIGMLMRQLGVANTMREIKHVLNSKAVMVNGKVVKDAHFGVGLMDAISVKPGKSVRCTIDTKGRLVFKDAPESEMSKKLSQVTGKRTVKGAKIQVNFSDGRSMLMQKDTLNVGDGVLLELPKQKVLDQFKFEKGTSVLLLGGRHTGLICTIEDVQGKKLVCKHGAKRIETLTKVAFPVGSDKPVVKL